jgi:hypothetical protein
LRPEYILQKDTLDFGARGFSDSAVAETETAKEKYPDWIKLDAGDSERQPDCGTNC